MRLSMMLCLGVCVFCLTGASDKDWNERKCQHFIIYYKNAPVDFINNVEKSAENYYDEIMQNLGFRRYEGWTWEKRARIYIYDSAEDYVNTANQYAWSSGSAAPASKMIRTYPSAHGFFDSTLPHELGHIVFREYIGYDVSVPLWLEEGIAMYQEKAKRWGSHQAVKNARKDGSFIPLGELTLMRLSNATPRPVIDLFYAEAASVVYYMITELGDYRFSRFCRELKQKKNFIVALKSVYQRFNTIDDLNRAWEQYLK